jgi:hypothetical protein
MTIVHRLMYSTFGGGGGGGGNIGPSTSKPNHTLDTLHSNIHWAVGPALSKPYGSKIQEAMILACSSKTTQVQLLASREVNGPLCRHRKGFLDHLRPRPVIVSVRDDSFSCCLLISSVLFVYGGGLVFVGGFSVVLLFLDVLF